MVGITTWFTVGTAGMLVATVGLALGTFLLPKSERRRFALLVAVPAIAFVAYGLMARGVGGMTSPGGGTVYLPRYVDWLLTTPIHVTYIGLLVEADRGLILKTAALQAATIVLGLAGALTTVPLNAALFLAGSAVFALVVWYVYGAFDDAAEANCDAATVDLFRKIRSFVVVLWLVYPFIWMLAPAGQGLMDIETTSLVITYIDVVAKGGFGLIVLNDLRIMDAVANLGSDAARTAD